MGVIMHDLSIRGHGRRRGGVFAALAAFLLVVVAPGSKAAETQPSATVEIKQTQIAFIGNANLGGGKLFFNGKTYNFTIGGLGLGGIGFSSITATGKVYNLTDVSQFPGAYVQGSYGFAAGSSDSGGLWLRNDAGVVMELKTQREGLALSVGATAIYIEFDK
jgi:hypothetical protein